MREYLELRQYGAFWACEYNSPSLGMTLVFGSERTAKDLLKRLNNMPDGELSDYIEGRVR